MQKFTITYLVFLYCSFIFCDHSGKTQNYTLNDQNDYSAVDQPLADDPRIIELTTTPPDSDDEFYIGWLFETSSEETDISAEVQLRQYYSKPNIEQLIKEQYPQTGEFLLSTCKTHAFHPRSHNLTSKSAIKLLHEIGCKPELNYVPALIFLGKFYQNYFNGDSKKQGKACMPYFIRATRLGSIEAVLRILNLRTNNDYVAQHVSSEKVTELLLSIKKENAYRDELSRQLITSSINNPEAPLKGKVIILDPFQVIDRRNS